MTKITDFCQISRLKFSVPGDLGTVQIVEITTNAYLVLTVFVESALAIRITAQSASVNVGVITNCKTSLFGTFG